MLLFAWRRLTPPAFIGGAELTEAEIATILATSSDVEMVGSYENPRDPTQSSLPWLTSLLEEANVSFEISPSGVVQYFWNGIACLCAPQSQVDDLILSRSSKARVVWTSQEGSDAISRSVDPGRVATYVHSVSDTGLRALTSGPRWIFAPSLFVADFLAERGFARAHLLRPPYPIAAPITSPGTRVLFVNPVPEKGVTVATSLAERFASVHFDFLEAWRPIAETEKADLPANVTLLSHRRDPSPLFESTRVLLVPSIVEDASPRVISEAACRGIPSVGSLRGGIPELIAQSEYVIDPSDIDLWTIALEKLLAPGEAHEQASRKQRQLSQSLYPNVDAILHQAALIE